MKEVQEKSMHPLIEGFIHYRKNRLPGLAPLYRKLAHGQKPRALLFGCSDSRVDPNLVTSSKPGEIFIHRSVGNLVPPAGADGRSRGDISEASAIEYAVEVLGVKDIVVFGHSACGAMKAVREGLASPDLTPNLAEWLRLGRPALERALSLPMTEGLGELDRISQANVVVQLENIRTYPLVKRRLETGAITLHGSWFDVSTGEVRYYSPGEARFVPIPK